MYIMCVVLCLFIALSLRVGALQISIIIIIIIIFEGYIAEMSAVSKLVPYILLRQFRTGR